MAMPCSRSWTLSQIHFNKKRLISMNNLVWCTWLLPHPSLQPGTSLLWGCVCPVSMPSPRASCCCWLLETWEWRPSRSIRPTHPPAWRTPGGSGGYESIFFYELPFLHATKSAFSLSLSLLPFTPCLCCVVNTTSVGSLATCWQEVYLSSTQTFLPLVLIACVCVSVHACKVFIFLLWTLLKPLVQFDQHRCVCRTWGRHNSKCLCCCSKPSHLLPGKRWSLMAKTAGLNKHISL